MDKYIYDESNGLWYELQGEYYLPCLALPTKEEKFIGIWGQRHARYLNEHHRALYMNLLTSGKLNSHLAEIDKQAEDMFLRLVKEMAVKQGATEQLKATDQMAWVKMMNKIRVIANEIVYAELIYA